MLEIIYLVLAGALSLSVFLWAVSSAVSVFLGAPAISSPVHDGWKTFADKEKTFLDLGSGSGLVCFRAAPYFKHVYGIEGSPFYYIVSRWRTRKLKNVTIIFGNFMWRSWPKTDYIYCYLLDKPLRQLKTKLSLSPATVMTMSFAIDGWQADQEIKDNHRTLHVYRPLSRLGKSK